ncbi:glucose dehydrogenase [FAD, quinone]-like [Ostrinia nubilalis]|uniref:glucose dehydrogenase [FAD, quinone]-like n=1 Tax=Ostrinia nubilalis TaxID=29057 RepID=UPI0030824FA1
MFNMWILNTCHWFILFICVNSFSCLIYLIYYGQLITSKCFDTFENEYDYIIVGSGTAGSVIAHRLATETNFTFIVLEAGGKGSPLFDIPVLGPMLHGSVYDWQLETTPQENACLAMNDKICKLPQGKIVGGSSKLNNMIHVRGNISHYVDWFQGKYTKGFIKQQFQFVEDNILHLDNIQYESELATAIVEAAKELGYSTIEEFNKGFRKSKVSQNKGKRWSTSDNLDISKHILTNALVEKVNIKDGIANGVTVFVSNKSHKIKAKRGVILSAGAYNTPKILELSGIGPKSVLDPLNIPVIKDLPVGFNLQDHIATGLDLVLFNKSLAVNPMNMLNPFNVHEYFVNGRGPLTTPGCEAIGFLSTKNDETPDLQFMVMPVGISADRGTHLKKSLGINETVWENYFVKAFDKHAATILPIILHPKSKGQVYINSNDPKMPPCVDPKYLSNNDDVITLIDGIKLVIKFVNTLPMKALGAHINPMHFPGCEEFVFFSDKYWECYVRHLTLTSYHPVGTCTMGPSSSSSVVDINFRVHGVESLFIADASVLPTLPSGNINAAIAMMASLFFETGIKLSNTYHRVNISLVCHKSDYIFENLQNVCLRKQHSR